MRLTSFARFSAVAGALILIPPATAVAGSFSVNPLRVRLDANHPTSTFRLRNESDDKIVIQIGAAEWRQALDGADIYQPSTDLVLFPKIVEIDKGGEKNVRLGMAAASPSDSERAFRVYFDELPVSKPGESTVRLALRLGVPVFFVPLTRRTAAKIDTVALMEGTLEVRVRNDGNAHVMARRVAAVGGDGSGAAVFRHEQTGWYVLAGAARTFRLPLPGHDCVRATTIRAKVEIEDSRPPERNSTLEAKLAVSRASCMPDSFHAKGSNR